MNYLTYRADIDGLRAVAVLSVVVFHAFPSLFPGGFIGVDIFFVISGYLITSILFASFQNGSFSFFEFYVRRINRIFPALLLVMAACYLFGWKSLFASEFSQLGKHIAGGASFISNLVLLRESGYFDSAALTKPLLHLWSLGIEEQFYMAWPLLLWLIWKIRANIVLVALLLASISFALNIYRVGEAQSTTFYSPITRFWELLVGAILVWSKRENFTWIQKKYRFIPNFFSSFQFENKAISQAKYDNIRATLGGIFIAIGLAVATEHKSFPGWLATLPVLGTALVISAGNKAWLNEVILSNRVFVWFGLISFPLYLWHWPLLSFLRILDGGSNRVARVIAMIAAIALAWLTYRFVELPIRQGTRRNWKPFVMCLLMLITGSVGFITYEREGYKSRPAIQGFGEARALLSWPSNNNFDNLCPVKYPGSGYCKVAKNGPGTVALIGDSQANHFFPGLAQEYLRIGENLVNLGCGACPPLAHTSSRYSGKPPIGMATMDHVLKMVVEDQRIHTVLLAANWHIYLTGTRFSDESKTWPLWEIRSNAEPQILSNEKVFNLQMRETIASLQRSGKKIVVIKQIPELNYLPSVCLALRPFSLAKKPEECLTPVATVEKYLNEYEQIFDNFFAQFPEIAVWDPKKTICDSQFCYVMKDGMPMYRDELHLSEHGSRIFAKSVRDFLSPGR